MPVVSEQGVVIVATDVKSCDMALNLAISLRANDPFACVALIYSQEVLAEFTSNRSTNYNYRTWFDYFIECPKSLARLCETSRFSYWPQLYLDELSPFQRTLYIDNNAVLLPSQRITRTLEKLKGLDVHLPVAAEYPVAAKLTAEVRSKYVYHYGPANPSIYQVQPYAYYFERTPKSEKFFSDTRECARDLLEQSLYTENDLYALALGLGAHLLNLPRTQETILSGLRESSPMDGYVRNNHYKELLFLLSKDNSEDHLRHYRLIVSAYSKPRGLELNPQAYQDLETEEALTIAQASDVFDALEVASTAEALITESDTIPDTVHQIWINLDGSNSLPERYVPMVNSWFTYSKHTHHIHSHKELSDLLAKDYPQFLEFYHRVSYITEKSDICRYLLMHKYGGVYVDADMVCHKPLTPLLQAVKHPICMCLEPPTHKFWDRTLIGSAFVASQRGLNLWLELIEFMQEHYRPNSFPVFTTGPIIVDYFLHERGYKANIEFIDSQYMFPVCTSGETFGDPKDSFCTHVWTGSDSWLAQVPSAVRQAIYDKEYDTLEEIFEALDKRLPNKQSLN